MEEDRPPRLRLNELILSRGSFRYEKEGARERERIFCTIRARMRENSLSLSRVARFYEPRGVV